MMPKTVARFVVTSLFAFNLSLVIPAQSQGESVDRRTFRTQDFQLSIDKNEKILFYFVSAGMPLSGRGIRNVRSAAKKLGYALQLINDPHRPVSAPIPLLDSDEFSKAAGVPLHFPALLVFKMGRLCGHSVPGFKDERAFVQIIRQQEMNCDQGIRSSFWIGSQRSRSHVLSKAGQVISEIKIPREKIAYYFRAIDDRYVSYHTGTEAFIFDRQTKQEFKVPGDFDSISTPDAMFLTTPNPLRFFSVGKLLADPANAYKLSPEATDQEMTDYYQSVGVLESSVEKVAYRVLTAWYTGAVVKDYFLDRASGNFTFGASKKTICQGLPVSTPLISKDGLYMGALANSDAQTKIIFIGVTGSECRIAHDLGKRTSKVQFNRSINKVVYAALATDQSGKTVVEIFDMQSGSTSELFRSEGTDYLAFPDFLPNDNVMVMRVKRFDDGHVENSLIEIAP